MRVLVTGGTGFLGSHVVERLLEADHEVRALVRATSDTRHLTGLGVQLVVGAVDEPPTLCAAVRGVDVIVHCAGLVKALNEAAFDVVNAHGTQHILDAARAEAPGLQRFVHVSSIAAGGPGGPGQERGPVSAYGRSKRRGEDAARAAADAFPVTVVRPPVIYGPRDREVLPAFRAVKAGLLPLFGQADARFSMIYVEDCAAAVVAAVERPHGREAVYPVDDGVEHTWPDLARTMAEALGVRKLRTIQVPGAVTRMAGRMGGALARLLRRPILFTDDKVVEIAQPDWICGHEAITHDLGWCPAVDAREGFARTAEWYRERRWL